MGNGDTSSDSEPQEFARSEHGSDEETSSSASESGDEKVEKIFFLQSADTYSTLTTVCAWKVWDLLEQSIYVWLHNLFCLCIFRRL